MVQQAAKKCAALFPLALVLIFCCFSSVSLLPTEDGKVEVASTTTPVPPSIHELETLMVPAVPMCPKKGGWFYEHESQKCVTMNPLHFVDSSCSCPEGTFLKGTNCHGREILPSTGRCKGKPWVGPNVDSVCIRPIVSFPTGMCPRDFKWVKYANACVKTRYVNPDWTCEQGKPLLKDPDTCEIIQMVPEAQTGKKGHTECPPGYKPSRSKGMCMIRTTQPARHSCPPNSRYIEKKGVCKQYAATQRNPSTRCKSPFKWNDKANYCEFARVLPPEHGCPHGYQLVLESDDDPHHPHFDHHFRAQPTAQPQYADKKGQHHEQPKEPQCIKFIKDPANCECPEGYTLSFKTPWIEHNDMLGKCFKIKATDPDWTCDHVAGYRLDQTMRFCERAVARIQIGLPKPLNSRLSKDIEKKVKQRAQEMTVLVPLNQTNPRSPGTKRLPRHSAKN